MANFIPARMAAVRAINDAELACLNPKQLREGTITHFGVGLSIEDAGLLA